jgi:hypothetical protein
MGRLPGGQQLPSHDDPVWLQLGPLGGVSFALDTVIKHTRVSNPCCQQLRQALPTRPAVEKSSRHAVCSLPSSALQQAVCTQSTGMRGCVGLHNNQTLSWCCACLFFCLCLQEQHVRVRELQGEFDKMEDRVRAESAQKADLQVRRCRMAYNTCPVISACTPLAGQSPHALRPIAVFCNSGVAAVP